LAEDDSALLVIGTGPDEWFKGRKAVLEAFAEDFVRYPEFRIEVGDIDWVEDGNVAWFADQPTLVFPGGARATARHTGVLQRTEGTWRLVQSHLSFPAAEGS
jgi:ketosteroid isomerase-like protein